jgi:hypothetical protein
LRTVPGNALKPEHAKLAYRFYEATCEKNGWGGVQLNQKFFERAFETMPEHLELVLAERNGKAIAGAFNLVSPKRLFGRYWGCFEEHPFLHFNVCLYHSIDECIRRGVQVFEGGAGGEHKIARGFEPAETYSAHAFLDERLDVPLRAYIEREAAERATALSRWRLESPILRLKTTT